MDSINKIDATVTQLLRHTKGLLTSLEQWAYGGCSEEQVSDEYVKLGNEFNLACRYFVDAGVDISDLGDVTVSLRKILEAALSDEQCQATLDECIPSIRDIVMTLLRQLKHKQAALRQKTQKHRRVESNASSTSLNSQQSRRTPSGPASGSGSAPYLPNQSPKRMPSDASERVERSDALSQLQKSHALERRASKRYSSYTMKRAMNGDQLPTSITHAPIAVPADYTDASVVEDRVRRMPPVPESPSPSSTRAAAKRETDEVFLRVGKKVRKGFLKLPASLPAIRLLFVDLFGYTPAPGEVFPDLTIQDHNTGLEYELTEATLRDVKQGSLLTLVKKTEEEDAVEKQIKDLVAAVQDLSTKVDTKLGAAPPKLKSGFAASAGTAKASGSSSSSGSGIVSGPRISADSTEAFRQQLAVMRQICTKTVNSMRQEIKVVQSQMSDLKQANAGSNRTYMTSSQKKLTEDTTRLLSWVDDLQDIVEGQRKDVSTRGVRLSQEQLDGVSRDISKASQDVKELQAYIANENPTWVRTWETELNTVVEEQQFFRLQEQLVMDLEADLNNARKTFELVAQCAQTFSKSEVKRPAVAHLVPSAGEVEEAQSGLLSEIVALRPNHAQRAEAIERAEQLRKRELAQRSDEFMQELGDFVETGMLKQSGGIEEVERRRKERDDMIRAEQSKTEMTAEERELAKEERRRKRAAERATELQ